MDQQPLRLVAGSRDAQAPPRNTEAGSTPMQRYGEQQFGDKQVLLLTFRCAR